MVQRKLQLTNAGSYAIVIPESFIMKMGFKAGEKLRLEMDKQEIIIRKTFHALILISLGLLADTSGRILQDSVIVVFNLHP